MSPRPRPDETACGMCGDRDGTALSHFRRRINIHGRTIEIGPRHSPVRGGRRPLTAAAAAFDFSDFRRGTLSKFSLAERSSARVTCPPPKKRDAKPTRNRLDSENRPSGCGRRVGLGLRTGAEKSFSRFHRLPPPDLPSRKGARKPRPGYISALHGT